MPSVGTYRDLHTPELSSHLTGHLQGNLGGHGHESLLAAQSPGDHTLAGDGTVHTQELLDAVVLVLPVAGQDHHHLNTHTRSDSTVCSQKQSSRAAEGSWDVRIHFHRYSSSSKT